MSSNPQSRAKPDRLPQLAVDAKAVGAMLGLSVRTIRSMDAAGQLPRPIRLNGSVRWRVSELRAWLAAGAPSREAWEASRAKQDNSR